MRHRLAQPGVPLLTALAIACAPAAERAAAPEPARYLYAWAYDVDQQPEDAGFIIVIDADSSSATYATVLATVPAGGVGGMAHHTEQTMPSNGRPLFANAFHLGRSVLLDFADPLAPRIAGEMAAVPGYRLPHSFYRLSDGRVVATMQFGSDRVEGKPGGLALLDPAGALIRTASSADSSFPGARIRTYSGDVSEESDRIITVSSPMDDERTADVVQLWRLSDLALIKTLSVPASAADTMHHYPFEVRFLPGGREAFLHTYYCAMYHLTGLDGDTPRIERVHTLDFPRQAACGVPLLIGRWWIMPVEAARQILVFDVSDPRRPRQAFALETDSSFAPHWSARDPGSDRIVFPTERPEDARILIARFDTATGRLQWDETFREPGAGQLGVSLRRERWPHGTTGFIAPHGVVFGSGRPAP